MDKLRYPNLEIADNWLLIERCEKCGFGGALMGYSFKCNVVGISECGGCKEKTDKVRAWSRIGYLWVSDGEPG